MKLRCPRCGSFVPFQSAAEVVCTICSFSGPSPGVKVANAVQFPTNWRPGGTGEPAKEQKWVAIREPGDPEPTRTKAASGAGGNPALRGAPGNQAAPVGSALAAKPITAPRPAPPARSDADRLVRKKGGGVLPWWLVLLLTVLTFGLFGIWWIIRHRKR